MTVRIALAFGSELYCESIRVLLADDPGLEVVAAAPESAGQDKGARAAGSGADVMIVDFSVLDRMDHPGQDGMPALILVDTGGDKSAQAFSVVTLGVKGVLDRGATPELLKKCVRAVAAGEYWLNQEDMRALIIGLQQNDGEAGKKARARDRVLSGREKHVATLAGRGFSNWEIAEKLCISEHTVKAHLSNVYRKLDISGRSQLIRTVARNNAGTGRHAAGVA